jgi:hypothetical protein
LSQTKEAFDMLGYNELSELLDYDMDDGEIRWKKRISVSAVPGRLAGTVCGGYRAIKIKGKIYMGHRLAWLLAYGEWPNGEIDHINHDKLDNRIENLRVVSREENLRNKTVYSGEKCSTRFGIMGVRLINGRWRADIRVNGELIRIGFFDDWFDAVCARKSAEVKHEFHFNHGGPKVETNKTARQIMSKRLCGVSWNKERQKWEVYIDFNNRRIRFGRFDDYFEAVCVRKSAENQYVSDRFKVAA